jgi:hypothetical protein
MPVLARGTAAVDLLVLDERLSGELERIGLKYLDLRSAVRPVR